MIVRTKSAVRRCVDVMHTAWLASIVWFLSADLASADAGTTLKNPLSFGTVTGFISGALKAMVTISLPIISIFIVYAGFKFVVAQGSESAIEEAKKNLTYVVIGAILILGAWSLSQILAGTINQLRG